MSREGQATSFNRFLRQNRLQAAIAVLALGAFFLLYRRQLRDPLWIPLHDTLTQFTEFLYAYASVRQGELPLWNSYLYGGQPFYLLLNHGLLLNPIAWIWFAVGAAAQLAPKQAFVLWHLTDVVFFAVGGYVLARQLTRSRLAGWSAFIVLLFCGEAAYWPLQVYDLAVIEYAPWVLFLLLRYFEQQTAVRAVMAGLMIGIAANVYYPAYLASFLITLLILLAFLYHRWFARIDYRRLLIHSSFALPLIGLLMLPTYLIYRDITDNYFQIARYAGPDQDAILHIAEAYNISSALNTLKLLAFDLFIIPRKTYGEGAPMVGAAALSFALYELFAGSRRGLFWFLTACCMALNYLGPLTPFYHFMLAVSPYYSVIGVRAFFQGFIVLCLAVLAAFGAQRFIVQARSVRLPMNITRCRPLLLALLLPLLALLLPADQRSLPLGGALAILLLLLALAKQRHFRAGRANILPAAVLLLLLASGASSLSLLLSDRIMFNWKSEIFSYTSEFPFSYERPATYTVAQPLGAEYSGECCIDYYHLAERIDGPFYFDNWGSLHTQFVSREYYGKAIMNGFGWLMKYKLYWFDRYRVEKDIEGYDQVLEKNVLVVENDAAIRNRTLRQEDPTPLGAGERQQSLPGKILSKSANSLVIEMQTTKDLFLLYTDTYHDGFIAKIDGKVVPILKAMGVVKAVEVPEGRHIVEFLFQPAYRFVLIGYLAVSLPALLWIIAASVLRRTPLQNRS